MRASQSNPGRKDDKEPPPAPSPTNVSGLGLARRRRWLVEIVGGDLRLAEDEAGLRDLVARGLLAPQSRIYEVGDGPHASADIPALAHLFADAEITGPLTRASLRSLERARLSEELAILNRPLEDEEPFYEELPRSRIRPIVAALALLVLAGGAGYFAIHYRLSSDVMARAGTSNGEPAPVGLSPPAAAPTAVEAPDLANVPERPTPVSTPAPAPDQSPGTVDRAPDERAIVSGPKPAVRSRSSHRRR